MLTVALGGGMLLAALLLPGGNGRRRKQYSDASVRSDERRAAEQAESRTRKTGRESNSSLDALKGAFITAAASRIGGFLGQLLAGYRQETERRKRDHSGYSAT
jgi:hypothetical protein